MKDYPLYSNYFFTQYNFLSIKKWLGTLLLITISMLVLEQARASSACGLSLDHMDVNCVEDETGTIVMDFTTNEIGIFSYTFTSAPTPIPNGTFTLTAADINPATGFFQGNIAVFTGLQAGFYNVEVTTPNGSTCPASATIFVLDFSPPTVVCPSDITAFNDPGMCSATVEFPTTIATDNCNITVQESVIVVSGQTEVVVYTATDSNGNTATCSITVTVVDIELPYINCPSSISSTITDGACSQSVTWGVSATDNCGIQNVSATCFSPDGTTWNCSSGDLYPIGTTIVSNTATDNFGNSNSCTFAITVSDNTPNSLFFTGNIANGIYSAKQNITSNGNVPANGNVGFKAGQCVMLDEGFTVQSNADFSAEINDCN